MLALYLSGTYKVKLIDCDVENPNCHIFFDKRDTVDKKLCVFQPVIDMNLCNFCGKCQDVCQFNCLLVLDDDVMFFPNLCHPCKGCQFICPQKAISAGQRYIGDIKSFDTSSENLSVVYGLLNIGEARATPIIQELKSREDNCDINIYDSPPGAACPTVDTIKDSDMVMLVTEPTPFGLYDLKIAWCITKKLGLDSAIIINRSNGKDEIIDDFARESGTPVVTRIPYSRQFAENYSSGTIDPDFFPGPLKKIMDFLKNRLPAETL